jgi:hypothetical protein
MAEHPSHCSAGGAPSDFVMQDTMFPAAAEEESLACSWKLCALFCVAAHPDMYNAHMQLLPEYLRGMLNTNLPYMQKPANSLKNSKLLSFTMPRNV